MKKTLLLLSMLTISANILSMMIPQEHITAAIRAIDPDRSRLAGRGETLSVTNIPGDRTSPPGECFGIEVLIIRGNIFAVTVTISNGPGRYETSSMMRASNLEASDNGKKLLAILEGLRDK